MSRMEIPVVFQDWSTVHDQQRPWSPLQALMEARPEHEPVSSVVDLQPLREAVASCVDRLSDEDRFLLEATHVERITVRALAERLGLHKSHTYRLVKRAELRLRDSCLTQPEILVYLGVAGAIVPTVASKDERVGYSPVSVTG